MACPTIALALGANLGEPCATLLAVRPLLEQTLQDWWHRHMAAAGPPLPCRWSPLFRTSPVGGPADQPDYLNAALLLPLSADPGQAVARAAGLSAAAPLDLLRRLQQLEARFGRERLVRWGPRSLDLDLLWCGAFRLQEPALTLPHPRLYQRRFVLAPLAAIDPTLPVPPPEAADPALAAAIWLARLEAQTDEPPPQQLSPRPGWPE
jgi:2-amino-4-hydroxy-6-hydroxymethyldihydropteridine diphosphokinase